MAKKLLVLVLVFCAGDLLGNWQGDQQTLKDCAMSNAAPMAGGGSITCTVVKVGAAAKP